MFTKLATKPQVLAGINSIQRNSTVALFHLLVLHPRVGNSDCLHDKLCLAVVILQASLPRVTQTLMGFSMTFMVRLQNTLTINRRKLHHFMGPFLQRLNSWQTSVSKSLQPFCQKSIINFLIQGKQ